MSEIRDQQERLVKATEVGIARWGIGLSREQLRACANGAVYELLNELRELSPDQLLAMLDALVEIDGDDSPVESTIRLQTAWRAAIDAIRDESEPMP